MAHRRGPPGAADRRHQRRRGQAVHPLHQAAADQRARDRDGCSPARNPSRATGSSTAYPDYPAPEACLTLGGDFAFASAAWQIAEAHSAARARPIVYRYDYAPRTLQLGGAGRHACDGVARGVRRVPRRAGVDADRARATGDRRYGSVATSQRRWRSFGISGVPGDGWPRYRRTATCRHGLRPPRTAGIRSDAGATPRLAAPQPGPLIRSLRLLGPLL